MSTKIKNKKASKKKLKKEDKKVTEIKDKTLEEKKEDEDKTAEEIIETSTTPSSKFVDIIFDIKKDDEDVNPTIGSISSKSDVSKIHKEKSGQLLELSIEPSKYKEEKPLNSEVPPFSSISGISEQLKKPNKSSIEQSSNNSEFMIVNSTNASVSKNENKSEFVEIPFENEVIKNFSKKEEEKVDEEKKLTLIEKENKTKSVDSENNSELKKSKIENEEKAKVSNNTDLHCLKKTEVILESVKSEDKGLIDYISENLHLGIAVLSLSSALLFYKFYIRK